MTSEIEPTIHTLYEPSSGTWQYIVADPSTRKAAIIDPVLDFDSGGNVISTTAADAILSKLKSEKYTVTALLETHIHADHLSSAAYLREQLKRIQDEAPTMCIGNISCMQKLFGQRYCVPEEEWADAFDRQYQDGDILHVGNLTIKVLHLPGHTPDHLGYMVGRNVFTGDSIFNPDLGSARCDFPNGSASALWSSMKRLLSLPEDFKLFTGHDYPPADRTVDGATGQARAFATVEEHRKCNKHAKNDMSEDSFIELRTTRDATLKEPRLINQALQFNIRGGKMPEKTVCGDQLIHVPLKVPCGFATI